MANPDTGLVKQEAVYVSIAECGVVSGTAVVIDVLRAYTTAAWAFHLGAERILLTDDTDRALGLKASLPGALALKDSRPYDGFDLTNSPIELQSHDLKGRTIVQRTNHGTVGAVAASAADHLYCASFVNAAATARALRDSVAEKVYYVITGDDGLADEDRACAEYIAALVEDTGADAAPFLRRAAASNGARVMARRVAEQVPGVHARDTETCLEANRFEFVMKAREEAGLLTLRAYN